MKTYERAAMAKGLALGMFIGGIVSAAVALLYAPKEGSQLRADLREKGKKLAHDVEKAAGQAKTKAREALDATKAKVEREEARLIDATKAGVDAYKEERAKTTG